MREQVREILMEELKGVLSDVSYRLGVLYAAMERNGQVGSRDLNLAQHQLDGYLIEDNKPTAGSVQWTDVNIVYKGTNYAIQNGNTANKYVYWQFTATDKTILQTSNTKPTLTDDDVLVFVNDGGVHTTEIGSGTLTHGATIVSSSLSGAEVKNGAIGTLQLGSGAVTDAILADNAVTAGKIITGAVTGVEALLRWNSPVLGSVPPLQFIPIAEETGMILPIGNWVLQTACAQNVAWQKQGLPAICMAVNL